MPGIRISVTCLIYKSVRYLQFVLDSLIKYTPSLQTGETEFYFVTNNATDEVLNYLKDHNISHYIFTTPYKQKPYPQNIGDIYRAWNYGIKCAKGKIVVLINSDMAFSKEWLENLTKYVTNDRVVTSRLVESGKIRSTFPYTLVRNFGRTPETFQERMFLKYAKKKKEKRIAPGGTFMPVAFYKDIIINSGGYPLGNIKGMGGDQYFFQHILASRNIKHYTSLESIVYHIQTGEVDA